jgi:hypothetical protein
MRCAPILVACVAAVFLSPVPRIAAEQRLWQYGPLQCPNAADRNHAPPACGGALAGADDDLWIVCSDPRARPDVWVQRLGRERAPTAPMAVDLPDPTRSIRLGRTGDGRIVLITADTKTRRLITRVARPAQPERWDSPRDVKLDGSIEALGPPALTASGSVLLPVVRRTDAGSFLTCYTWRDDGAPWRETGELGAPAAADPALAAAGGEVVLVFRAGTRLLCSRSADSGTTWSPPADTGIQAAAETHALASDAERMTLVWTESPDTSLAPPQFQGLRRAVSTDAGRTWQTMPRLLLHPGRVPVPGGLVLQPDGLAVLVEERAGVRKESPRALSCLFFPRSELEPPATAAPVAAGRYGIDTLAARAALRVLGAHTLYRPRRAQRLFVEGYFMRSLVAAHSILGTDGGEWFDTRAGLARAIEYADTLAATQTFIGFWTVGYGARYFADMAAAVALFPALEPYVDPTRRQRYQRAGERFVEGLAREGLFLDGGAVGVGREFSAPDPTRSRGRSRRPYLVSTALAGIEVNAWLHRATKKSEYRERALAALDYTLAQIAPDGFQEPLARQEGSLRVAAYIEEGWMAADYYLNDESVRARLRRALPRHVNWLLRTQRPDGIWDLGEKGGFSRTPGIVDFLIWYDQRCESRPDVRAAVQRASAVLLDPERWPACGLFRRGEDHEVLRALAGRPLAALAASRSVP